MAWADDSTLGISIALLWNAQHRNWVRPASPAGMSWPVWHAHGSSTTCSLQDVSTLRLVSHARLFIRNSEKSSGNETTLRWHSRRLLWHAHRCGHSEGRSMWRVTSNVSGLVATQIWASTDETLLPCGSRPCCCHWGGMAVRVFTLNSKFMDSFWINEWRKNSQNKSRKWLRRN